MLNEDKRSLLDILDDIRKIQASWIQKEVAKKECDMCRLHDKCWFHRSGQEQYETNQKKLNIWN